MHDQGIAHGNLSGVRSLKYESPSCPQLTRPAGEHPDRQQWLRLFSGLLSTRDNLGPVNRYILSHKERYSSMDEPRTP